MDNSDKNNHVVSLNDRSNITFSGIKKINSFDENEFFIDSVLGSIVLKGESLELIQMDTFQGNLSVKGKIDSITYIDDNKKAKADNIISRLFR